MKAFCVAALLCMLGIETGAASQGQIYVSNQVASTVDAPVFDIDCQTLLEGPAYLAQLYYGLSADSLSPVGMPVAFATGRRAGYFNAGAVEVEESRVPVFVQVRAWAASAGASYELAAAANGKRGVSNIFTVIPIPPTPPPAELLGLQSFCLVPEPSPVALGLLGLAMLWLEGRRRRLGK